MLNIPGMNEIIKLALSEDIGSGDVTTMATVAAGCMTKGHFIAKEDCIICGLPVVERVFTMVDTEIFFLPAVPEGTTVKKGDIIATVTGPAQGILTAERTALNLLQRLSGVATYTQKAVSQVQGTHALIVDTRKTLPGMRGLEKYAVRIGGGVNHRFGLYDGVLIKDNHIRAAGGIQQAVSRARQAVHHLLKIEVEVESLTGVEEALQAGADVIMLDNMNLDDMAKAIRIINGRALSEASGNMDARDLRAVAQTGVDLISIGALTHSARAMDISLRF